MPRRPRPPETLYARHYVSLPPEIEAALNRAMVEQGRKRSQIVADALRQYLGVEEART